MKSSDACADKVSVVWRQLSIALMQKLIHVGQKPCLIFVLILALKSIGLSAARHQPHAKADLHHRPEAASHSHLPRQPKGR